MTYDPENQKMDGGIIQAFPNELAVFVIDLSMSLEKQLSNVSKLASIARKARNLPKAQLTQIKPVEWTRYLRVLDADNQGENIETIAKVIWHDSDDDDPEGQAERALKNAKKWTNRTKYFRLLRELSSN